MSDLGVRSGGDPTQWHGAFDCSACGRKRLPAVEFSQNMANKARKDPSAQIRCKARRPRRRRSARSRRRRRSFASLRTAIPSRRTSARRARRSSPRTPSRAQLNNKGPGKQRCRECCDAAEAEASASASASVDQRLAVARAASKKAEATDAPDKLAVFAREAALEAELVTGLKPQRVGGRGRGRGGRGSRGTRNTSRTWQRRAKMNRRETNARDTIIIMTHTIAAHHQYPPSSAPRGGSLPSPQPRRGPARAPWSTLARGSAAAGPPARPPSSSTRPPRVPLASRLRVRSPPTPARAPRRSAPAFRGA